MTELIPPPAWIQHGLCGQIDPDAFFPDKGGSGAAKTICNGTDGDDRTRYRAPCPVRDQCRAWAMDDEPGPGIYGGLSRHDRDAIRREEREAA